jgi:hypothetical protein
MTSRRFRISPGRAAPGRAMSGAGQCRGPGNVGGRAMSGAGQCRGPGNVGGRAMSGAGQCRRPGDAGSGSARTGRCRAGPLPAITSGCLFDQQPFCLHGVVLGLVSWKLPGFNGGPDPAEGVLCPRPNKPSDPQRSGRTLPMPAVSRIPAQRTSSTSRRRSRGRNSTPQVPLGSLTQREDRTAAVCQGCGSEHVTHLRMNLTDGTPVRFTSCHHCEHRTWENAEGVISMDTVLDRTRKAVSHS